MITNLDLSSCYTENFIEQNGLRYQVLATKRVNFGDDGSCSYGKKTSSTKVWRAAPGDVIVTDHNGTEETPPYTAEGGEVVFCNELPNNRLDVYVPRDQKGVPNGDRILETAYTLISSDLNEGEAYYVPNSTPVKVAAGIDRLTCLENAYGEGNHQFLKDGDILKQDASSRVTGIDREAFNFTWSLTDRNGVPLDTRDQTMQM